MGHDDKLQSLITNASLGAQHVWNLVERASQATDAEAYVRQSVAQPVELQELLRVVIATYRQTHSGIDFQLQGQLQGVPIRVQADRMAWIRIGGKTTPDKEQKERGFGATWEWINQFST
jgi:hypothetical protein